MLMPFSRWLALTLLLAVIFTPFVEGELAAATKPAKKKAVSAAAQGSEQIQPAIDRVYPALVRI